MTAASPRTEAWRTAVPVRAPMIGLERGVACVVLFLVAARFDVGLRLTSGTVCMVLCVPLWLSGMRSNRLSRLVTGGCVLAAASGYYLAVNAEPSRSVDHKDLFLATSTILVIAASVAFVVWSRRILSVAEVSFVFALGLLVGRLVNQGVSDNPWKFTYQLPVTVMLVAVSLHLRKPWLQVAVLAYCAYVSSENDGRSAFLSLALSAAIIALQHGRVVRNLIPRRWWAGLLVLVLVGSLGYNTAESFILDGGLGAETQARSKLQLEQSGSLILGGRPELAATVGLMQNNPVGYGAGVEPSLYDIDTAKTAMAASGYPPDNGYVESYMFGGDFELHSLVGDLWAVYGLGGIVLLLLFAGLTIVGLSYLLVERRLDGVVLSLGVSFFWDLAFSPIFSSTLPLILFVGLLCASFPRPAVSDDPNAAIVVEPFGRHLPDFRLIRPPVPSGKASR